MNVPHEMNPDFPETPDGFLEIADGNEPEMNALEKCFDALMDLPARFPEKPELRKPWKCKRLEDPTPPPYHWINANPADWT